MSRPAASGDLLVVGAGRVGLSLAAAAHDAGLFSRVEVFARRTRPGPVALLEGRSVELLGSPPTAGAPPSVLAFCLPDDRLDEAVATWADRLPSGPRPPAVALHTSGAHPAAALAPLARVGYRGLAWHPLVALPRPRPDAFEGIAVGVHGEEEAVAFGHDLARAVGAKPLAVAPGAAARYHAAAVFASNHLAACLAVALREIRAAGAGTARMADLLPLARSALDGLAAEDLPRGLTGPLARGDLGTVRRHLDALDPTTAALYRGLARELVRVLGPDLDPAVRQGLEEALKGS